MSKMANVLSRSIGWLVEFVREVDRGIAVGYGYEPPEKVGRRGCGGFQTRRNAGCRHRKMGKQVRDDR
jgi:hypothetical protein